jgi:cytochrome c oxidase subunit 2
MAMLVQSHEPRAFRDWWDAQLRSQERPPADPLAAKGREVFLRNGCGLCHTVRGTDAHGTVAPDLTHFGSRRTIAAGTLPNTRGHLAGWISDPQSVKPGTRMPAVPLDGEELRALLSYLHSLK